MSDNGSDGLYRSIFENAIEGIFQTTPEGRFLRVNPAMAEMLGYTSPEEFLSDIIDIRQQLCVRREDDLFLQLFTHGKVLDYILEFFQKDRSTVWVSISVRLIRDARTGKPRIIEGHCSDITVRRKTEQDLISAHQRIDRLLRFNEAVFSAVPTAVFYKDRDGRYLGCNNAFTDFTGMSAEQIMGKTVMDVWPDELAQMYHQKDLELMANPRRQLYEYKVKDKIGQIRPVIYAKDVFRDEYGNVAGIIGSFQDISERKQAEEALQRMNEELEIRVRERTRALEQANGELKQISRKLEDAYNELKTAQSRILQQEKLASVGQLAAGVAHEINNPIGFIMSNLNSLRKCLDKVGRFVAVQSSAMDALAGGGDARIAVEEVRKCRSEMKIDVVLPDTGALINESMEGAERVRRIVQDLKGFSRLGEAQFEMADINKGLESTINIAWNEIKYKAELAKEYGELPLTYCNLSQLNQVFMNILLNAVHAIQTQGKIVVKTRYTDDDIRVSISDTGTGIPDDIRDKIFEPFFTTKDVGKGTGLGLSIAYDIVKKHKGDILVQSMVGKGTTFTIVIPVVGKKTVVPE